MTTHIQISQLAMYFVVLLPLLVGLSAPGIFLASLIARRWRGIVRWRLWEYALFVPLVLIWYSSFALSGGKTWANLALEPLLIGFAALPYVCIRRFGDRGWRGYVIAMAVCGLAVELIARYIPMIPCSE
jgi:hypothetical protein